MMEFVTHPKGSAALAWAALGGVALAGVGPVVHLRHSETAKAAMNLHFIALLIAVAWGPFGSYQF
ncbi:hypothetical protein [Streptomyces griseorubiginosus]|nr:hypothetical protein [Streptomyces griseorubiginosus]